MMLWALLVSMVLGAGPVWAKVVSDFNECNQFFYRGTAPQGIPQDESSRKICQKYKSSTYYASLYSMSHRIPLYSAYTFNPSCSSGKRRRSGKFFIEPQLSGFREDEMMPDSPKRRQVIKANQAVNDDYNNTGYDRRHLNPNSFQCGEGRPATFTLTNIVPMDACFNRVHWKQWEDNVRDILNALPENQGTAFLVTGTVPAEDYRIPRQWIFDDPNSGEFNRVTVPGPLTRWLINAPGSREFNRVTVPGYVWTAVCYKNNIIEELSFSFGYLGLNQPDSRINVMTVETLNTELSTLYNVKAVRIFTDDCYFPKSDEMDKMFYRSIQLNLRVRLDMPPTGTGPKQVHPEKTIDVCFNSLETCLEKTESVKHEKTEACVLSKPFTGLKGLSNTDHRKTQKKRHH